jgi:hypothetical protein
MVTRARLTPDQIDAIDFRSYLACSSDEDEDDDEDEKKDRKKKKKAQSDMSAEQGQTAKLALQEKINDYEQLVGAADDAMARLPKKAH